MDETLRKEVAKYLFAFLGNGFYHDEKYLNSLIKKYGKKTILEAIKEISENGNISDAFS